MAMTMDQVVWMVSSDILYYFARIINFASIAISYIAFTLRGRTELNRAVPVVNL